LYIADLVDSLAPERRLAVQQQFESIVTLLESGGMIEQLLDPVYSDEPVLAVAREYFKLGRACPFLVDESCGIHAHRPVACREFNVTSPPEWCADPYSHEIAKVSMPLPLSAPLARLTAGLTETKPRLIPLTLALRWAADQQELRHRTWPGPELFPPLSPHAGHMALRRLWR
jgi:hypothetical protein